MGPGGKKKEKKTTLSVTGQRLRQLPCPNLCRLIDTDVKTQ